jgi:hypothetical protein
VVSEGVVESLEMTVNVDVVVVASLEVDVDAVEGLVASLEVTVEALVATFEVVVDVVSSEVTIDVVE